MSMMSMTSRTSGARSASVWSRALGQSCIFHLQKKKIRSLFPFSFYFYFYSGNQAAYEVRIEYGGLIQHGVWGGMGGVRAMTSSTVIGRNREP